MTRILLDTNAYGHFLKGNDDVYQVILAAEVVYMSIFVLGELYFGFRSGSQVR